MFTTPTEFTLFNQPVKVQLLGAPGEGKSTAVDATAAVLLTLVLYTLYRTAWVAFLKRNSEGMKKVVKVD